MTLGDDPEFAKQLSRYKNLHVRVSIKGTNKEEYVRLTGAMSSSYDLPYKALEHLMAEEVSCNVCLSISFSNHEDASNTSFFWHGSFKVFELLIYVEDNQREYTAQFESSRNRLFFIRRWLRNVVRRMHGQQETVSPSYMWTDASARQYGPYTSIHEGPCT